MISRPDPASPPLDQKVILITGAARGIGACIAQHLAALGATLALGDLEPPTSWQKPPPDVDDNVLTGVLDVTDADSCRRFVAEVTERFGRIDGVVNNAGIVRRGPAQTMYETDFIEVLDVNLIGTFRVCQAAFDALTHTKGAIVNLASTNGLKAVKDSVGYCVSKAGITQLTRVLALEWAEFGIRVNAVGPTIVPTDMTSDVRQNQTYMEHKISSIPLGRMAAPDDVASAVSWLLSAGSGMVTGQTIYVDGGATIW